MERLLGATVGIRRRGRYIKTERKSERERERGAAQGARIDGPSRPTMPNGQTYEQYIFLTIRKITYFIMYYLLIYLLKEGERERYAQTERKRERERDAAQGASLHANKKLNVFLWFCQVSCFC